MPPDFCEESHSLDDREEESLSSHFADHDRFLYENLLRSVGVSPRNGESFDSFLNRNWI